MNTTVVNMLVKLSSEMTTSHHAPLPGESTVTHTGGKGNAGRQLQQQTPGSSSSSPTPNHLNFTSGFLRPKGPRDASFTLAFEIFIIAILFCGALVLCVTCCENLCGRKSRQRSRRRNSGDQNGGDDYGDENGGGGVGDRGYNKGYNNRESKGRGVSNRDFREAKMSREFREVKGRESNYRDVREASIWDVREVKGREPRKVKGRDYREIRNIREPEPRPREVIVRDIRETEPRRPREVIVREVRDPEPIPREVTVREVREAEPRPREVIFREGREPDTMLVSVGDVREIKGREPREVKDRNHREVQVSIRDAREPEPKVVTIREVRDPEPREVNVREVKDREPEPRPREVRPRERKGKCHEVKDREVKGSEFSVREVRKGHDFPPRSDSKRRPPRASKFGYSSYVYSTSKRRRDTSNRERVREMLKEMRVYSTNSTASTITVRDYDGNNGISRKSRTRNESASRSALKKAPRTPSVNRSTKPSRIQWV